MNRLRVKDRGRWLRGILLTGIVAFVAIAAFLLGRMDADQLGIEIAHNLAIVTQKKIQFRSAEFSFSHGFGLALHQVEVSGTGSESWELAAREVDVVPRLIPLLMGSLRFEEIFIFSPKISITAGFRPTPISLPFGFGLKHLNIRKGSLLLSSGKSFDHLLLDVRNISYNDKMLWELKARTGGKKLQSNGRANIVHGSISTAFGNLGAEGIPVQAFIKNRRLALFKSDHLNTNLTFNLARDGKWSASGNIGLQTKTKKPPLNLRGKFDGNTSSGQISWHDSFIQIGKQTIIETNGQYDVDGSFQATVRTKNARVEEILAAAHRNLPLHGKFDLNSKIIWKDGKLFSHGKAAWSSIAWKNIPIPSAKAVYGGLRIDPDGDKQIDWLELHHGKGPGRIGLESIHLHNGDWSASTKAISVEDWWVDIANAISRLAGVQSSWKGSGIINGEATIVSADKHLAISAHWDAGKAAIGFGSIFDKPENVPASGSITVKNREGDRQFIVGNLLLGKSMISRMQWQKKEGLQQFTIEAENLDFSEGQHLKIKLPEDVQALHGTVRGTIKSSRNVRKNDLTGWQGWIRSLNGRLKLTDFGAEGFALDGFILIKNGEASSPRLQWKSQDQTAMLRGAIDLWLLSGEVYVWNASLHVDQVILPSWLRQADLHGGFGLTQLDWLGNTWTDTYSGYHLKSGLLHLSEAKGHLAGGEIDSPGLDLDFSRQPVLFHGPLSVKNIHLDKLSPGQKSRFVTGTLSARTEMQGPVRNWHEWQGKGELSIERGSFIGIDFLNKVYSLIGMPQEKEKESTPFLHLNTQFELRDGSFIFSNFQFQSPAIEASGKGIIRQDNDTAANLDISLPAAIGNGDKKSHNVTHIPVRISGAFPGISMQEVKPSGQPSHP